MPRTKITFDTVRHICLAMPDVEEGTTYGTPAFKLRGRLLTCIPNHKSAEPNSLAVCVDFQQRTELLAAEPETYYLKDHYVNYPVVLVRLSRIHVDALRDLLGMAWRFANSKGPLRSRTARRTSGSGPARR